MNTTKRVSFILIAFLLFTSAAYAFWNRNLGYSQNVNTGCFNIAFSDSYLNNLYTDDNKPDEIEYSTITASLDSQDNKKININIQNLYPGAGAGFSFKIINKGSIPAAFDNASIEDLYDPNFLDRDNVLRYSIGLQKYNKNGQIVANQSISNGVINTSLLYQKINDKLSNWSGIGRPLILEPGEYLMLCNSNGEALQAGYFVVLPEDVTSYENSTLKFGLVLKFKQWNSTGN